MKKRVEFDKHHLLPSSKGWSSHPNNIVIMGRKKHEAYHSLFANQWVIEALIELFNMWKKCIVDDKYKKMIEKTLLLLSYKDECVDVKDVI